jgi:tryptophan synthase alpha chain
MNNRIDCLFDENKDGVLNIFYTAGYPALDSTAEIARALDKAGVKLVEVGMPYSDPLADGKTIQDSSQAALQNGMNLDIMFKQVEEISETTGLVIILMGYLNQLMTVGVEEFLKRSRAAGVDGLIIPDLPMDIYEEEYKELFEQYNMAISFLISPRTSAERIMEADRLSTGFLYMVADNSITGADSGVFNEAQMAYFERIQAMQLDSKVLIGFGIKTREQYDVTRKYANGAIIGSEFIRQLPKDESDLEVRASEFAQSILTNR